MSLFLRLLEDEDKGEALLEAVCSAAAGHADRRVFQVDPMSFEQVPGAPFSYWVSESVRRMFLAHSSFEADNRAVRLGASTKYDFRFVRLWWEPPFDVSEQWQDYANGGRFSRFYCSYTQSIKSADGFREIAAYLNAKFPYLKGNVNFVLHLENDYSRPSIAWPLRTHAFSPHLLPANTVFSARTYAALVDRDELDPICAVLASLPVDYLLKLMLGRFGHPEFVTAVVRSLPWPDSDLSAFSGLARKGWSITRSLDTGTVTSRAFVLPVLFQTLGANFRERIAFWAERVQQAQHLLNQIQSEIDERCFELYGFDEADRAAALGTASRSEPEAPDADDDSELLVGCNPKTLVAELFDWLVGVAFGRFDIRLATGERNEPPVPEPFDPLPVCSPGMLTDDDGLPLATTPPGYPVEFPADGILVDDAGVDGNAPTDADVIRRVQQVLKILTAETKSEENQWASPRSLRLRGESPETDLCNLLGVRGLRDWLRRPNGYFADHLSRYSKSRRKAPILWPLSTESGSYTLWIYYPRLTDQTLYSCVNLHIDPKLQEIERDLSRLLSGGQADSKTQKQIDTLVELQRELKSMREELLRVAKLPYKPDQNDGVLITAAPLWRLFRHKPWQKELKKCWEALESEKYEWAHLAYAIWPERVREVCKIDKSIAIAHDLEDLYEG